MTDLYLRQLADDAFRDAHLRLGGEVASAALYDRFAADMQDYIRERGRQRAEVEWTTVTKRDGKMVVTLEVTEPSPVITVAAVFSC